MTTDGGVRGAPTVSEGIGFRISGLGFRISGLVQDFGFRVEDFGLGFRVDFRVSGF